MALVKPSKKLATQTLATVIVSGADLYRISRHDAGEPFFGKTGANRFDDPSPKAKRYGVCYAGFDLITGVAETLLHDEMPKDGRFHVSAEDFKVRNMVKFKAEGLVLVAMLGVQLKTLAGGGELSAVIPYDIPQAWSRALHAHPQNFDGILYMSRHLNDRHAVAIFDRAQHKLKDVTYTPLAAAPGAMNAVLDLHISLSY